MVLCLYGFHYTVDDKAASAAGLALLICNVITPPLMT